MSAVTQLVKSLYAYDYDTQATIIASCGVIYPAVVREPFVQAWLLMNEQALAHSRGEKLGLRELELYVASLPMSVQRTKIAMGIDYCIRQAAKGDIT